MASSAAGRVLSTFEGVMGAELPIHVRCWDGSHAGPPESAARVVFRNRRALRRVVWSPNELGLARAYVSGDLDVEGDIFALLDVPDLIANIGTHRLGAMSARTIAATARSFLALGALGLPPTPPSSEMRTKHGSRHSKSRDSDAISHHYDVGNDFYRLFLGHSMVYSCAYWDNGTDSVDDAQHDKLDLICRKLGLEPGMRLLDVGCGWGSMAIHAAQQYGVEVVGVTLSSEQAEYARARVTEAELDDRVSIRVQDYRDVDDGPYDAISSIGMSEHVGLDNMPLYAEKLHSLLRPGGRLLNHAIASSSPLRGRPSGPPTFIDRYVFPDGEILPLSTVVDALERAGLETRDSDSLREHYALTLRAWVGNLRASWDEAVRLVGEERARTWLLYLAASALGFEQPHRLSIHQVLAVRPTEQGASAMPRTRAEWYTRSDSEPVDKHAGDRAHR